MLSTTFTTMHKILIPEKLPKNKLIDWLTDNRISYINTMYKAELLSLVEEALRSSEKFNTGNCS